MSEPYLTNCKYCNKEIELRQDKNGKWRSYEIGTNQFHYCKEYPNESPEHEKWMREFDEETQFIWDYDGD